MKTIKLSFTNFWGGFNPTKNFFYLSIKQFAQVEITNPQDADVIIFSCYDSPNPYQRNQVYTNPTQYPGKIKIFYTGENLRPDYSNLDYALSFDFGDNNKNIRLPLWMLYIDWFNMVDYEAPKFTVSLNEIENNKFYNTLKTKFCSIVYNHHSPYRDDIVLELSKYKPVDVYGSKYGNVGHGEDKKLEIISNYKFNLCLENSLHPGYYTEKLFHAKTAGCVPIYWADENASKDFNSKSFINLFDFNHNVRDLCEYVIELDKSNEKYFSIKNQPLFLPEQNPQHKFEEFITKLKQILI
jgi:hypothetical protein